MFSNQKINITEKFPKLIPSYRIMLDSQLKVDLQGKRSEIIFRLAVRHKKFHLRHNIQEFEKLVKSLHFVSKSRWMRCDKKVLKSKKGAEIGYFPPLENVIKTLFVQNSPFSLEIHRIFSFTSVLVVFVVRKQNMNAKERKFRK